MTSKLYLFALRVSLALLTPFCEAGPLVIGNPASAFTGISVEDVRSVLLLKTNRLQGQAVTLNIPAPGSPEYLEMAIALNVQPYVLERWWARAKYAGLAIIPTQFEDTSQIVATVSKRTHHIGIITADSCQQDLCKKLIVTQLGDRYDD